jgi:hypothetical protein
MQVTALDLVTLPDGTTWLRLKDRMVRWTTAAEYLAQLGLTLAAPAASGDPTLELANAQMDALNAELAVASAKNRAVQAKAKTSAAPAEKRGGGRATDPAIVAEAKRLFETTNDKLTAIAEQVGMKMPTLYAIAQREGWKRQALVKGGR